MATKKRKMKKSKKKMPKRRSAATEWMHLHTKPGPMRDRRSRRKNTRATQKRDALEGE